MVNLDFKALGIKSNFFSHICYNKNYTFIKMYCMVREEIYTQAYITIIDYIFIIDYIQLLITSL